MFFGVVFKMNEDWQIVHPRSHDIYLLLNAIVIFFGMALLTVEILSNKQHAQLYIDTAPHHQYL